ncbi:MAG: DinB family protein [Lutibacter sp.]|nr:DinB family protein [Lutibacter sp.]MDT8418220.1 DinB family protein [Lutibacter sp.]
MIDAIEKNLHRGIQLLNCISDNEYNNKTIAPYYSSIGIHTRHILDVFDCVLDGTESGNINLINRKRNELAENSTPHGIAYFEEILCRLKLLKNGDFNKIVMVTDDLGLGIVSVNYTLGGILIQAHSHAIHHFASVGYVISQLGIELPDIDFGFNPTTPKKNLSR